MLSPRCEADSLKLLSNFHSIRGRRKKQGSVVRMLRSSRLAPALDLKTNYFRMYWTDRHQLFRIGRLNVGLWVIVVAVATNFGTSQRNVAYTPSSFFALCAVAFHKVWLDRSAAW